MTSGSFAIKQHEVLKFSDALLEKTVLPGNGKYLMSFLCNDCEVLPFEDFKVYKTRAYDAFSKLDENRPINELHVHNLMESFKKDGYLFTVIYVNERIQIVDGQHRFEAAKRLHLPVYFIVMPGWGIKEVTVLNVNSQNWTMVDFLNTYAKQGKLDYVRLKEFFDNHSFDITTSQLIVTGRRSGGKGGGPNDEFRSGKMKVSQEQISKALKKAAMITDIKDFHPYAWKSRNCVEAFLRLFNVKGYDHKHLILQMKKYPDTMLFEARSLRVEEYLKIFVDKYNYRKRDKIEIV